MQASSRVNPNVFVLIALVVVIWAGEASLAQSHDYAAADLYTLAPPTGGAIVDVYGAVAGQVVGIITVGNGTPEAALWSGPRVPVNLAPTDLRNLTFTGSMVEGLDSTHQVGQRGTSARRWASCHSLVGHLGIRH